MYRIKKGVVLSSISFYFNALFVIPHAYGNQENKKPGWFQWIVQDIEDHRLLHRYLCGIPYVASVCLCQSKENSCAFFPIACLLQLSNSSLCNEKNWHGIAGSWVGNSV